MKPDLADRLRDALIDALMEAYEDAGLRGLCGEGRWEAAVGSVRAMPSDLILQHAHSSLAAPQPAAPGGRMAQNWKPESYNSVSPYLVVDDAARTIDFLTSAFDAEKLRQFPGPDGKLMHAEVRVGDTVVMLADGNEGWPPIGAHVHVYVPDVDATYRRALDAGAESIQEPVRKQDEDKRGGVKDPGGTTWWISTRQV